MTKAYLINLGCPKNLTDSEIILGLLEKAGLEICEDIESSNVMLLNTCAFIKEAKEESIDLILEMAKLKKQNPEKKVVVIGCLVQRYLRELIKELPEVDLWVTLQEIPKIASLIKNIKKGHTYFPPSPSSFLYDSAMPRHRITPRHYAYIKIAEGCSNRCSYCAVPIIKGNYKTKEAGSIIEEAEGLASEGVKELNIIAQDTTSYPNIADLLKRLSKIKSIKWIRLLYTHPAHIKDDLIEVIAEEDKICKYIDLPLQHIDDNILHGMGRKVDSSYIKNLIKKIRNQISGVALRTSFIVGFPGETEEKYERLLRFMEDVKFERLGIFTYSREEGTPAYSMPNQVPEKIKETRFHKAMELQNSIAREVNSRFLGKTMEVLIEELGHGRTYADAPDVDGVVYINPALSTTKTSYEARKGGVNGNGFKKGDMIMVKITDTMDYDLVGIPN